MIPLLCIPSGAGSVAAPRDAMGVAMGSRNGDLPSPQSQKWWVDHLLPMLVAKQSVQAVVWNQVFDLLPHPLAHGGLFDATGRPKPSLGSIIGQRRDHLA